MGTLFNTKICNLIENVQRRFTKHITGMNNLEYEQRLMALKLPRLEYRRGRRDMIKTFRSIHDYYDHETSLIKLYESVGTRGHPFKLHNKTVVTNQYAKFFTCRVINSWNSLPFNIVLAGTL